MRLSWIRCSCLCVMACQSAINGMLINMSLLNTRLPGLLPKVEGTPAHMACIAIDNALSTYCAALAIFCGGLPCKNVLRTFPTVWSILSHTALVCGIFAVVHTSLMWQFCNSIWNSCLVKLYQGCVHNAEATDNVLANIARIFLLQFLTFCH
jgi:hypothetical protein